VDCAAWEFHKENQMSVMTPIEIELADRYFIADSGYPADPISGERPRKLKFFAGG
jgi:hypothetical protein